jgi:thiol-disulfide isomerase/thioredoxin
LTLLRYLLPLLTGLLLAAPAALASADSVDFALLDDVLPIGEDTIDPRPAAGEVLLLQFWASWCHSCGSLMWDMDDIASRHENVRYIAVSLDDDADAARAYIRKHKLYSKYSDRYFVDAGKTLASSLDIETVPSILVVSVAGDVSLRKSGHLNSSDLRDIVTAIDQTH